MSETTRLMKTSMEEIDAYVKELQSGYDASARTLPLTLENILTRIYTRFYNGNGQSPLPNTLPFALQQIPSLASMAMRQARITAHVQCAVATRPVVTVHDLEEEICSMEGVKSFKELYLGVSLSVLPVVQQVFKLQNSKTVAPLTSDEFLHFLLYNPVSRTLLSGGGDAGDAVRTFAQRYKGGKYTSLQLGIHLQHFAWLQQLLRQEVSRVSSTFQRVREGSEKRVKRNALIYERVLDAMDAALAEGPDASMRPDDDMVRFSIQATVEEAETTTLPRTQWGQWDGPNGGLCLHGALTSLPMRSLNAVSCPVYEGTTERALCTLRKVPRSALMDAAIGATSTTQVEHLVSSSMTTTSIPPQQPQRRRRRGETIVDAPISLPNVNNNTVCSFQHAQNGFLNTSLNSVNDQVAEYQPHASSSSCPVVHLTMEKLLPLLRCIASLHHNARPDLSTLESYANVIIGCNVEALPFNVTANEVLRLVASSETPPLLARLYAALADIKGGKEESMFGAILLECLDSGLDDFVFLPCVGTKTLVPLSSMKGTMNGRVLLSGDFTCFSDPYTFHPLQYFSLDSVVIVDRLAVLRGLHDVSVQRHLLTLLAERGVLCSVPKSWFRNGCLAKLVEKEMSSHSSSQEFRGVLRVLILYWWFMTIWAIEETPKRDLVQENNGFAMDDFFSSISHLRWIPCLSSSLDNRITSNIHFMGWYACGDLFPRSSCFISHGLVRFLPFAPWNSEDMLHLSRLTVKNEIDEEVVDFLNIWIPLVRKETDSLHTENSTWVTKGMGMPSECTSLVALHILRGLKIGQCLPLNALRFLLRSLAGGDADVLQKSQEVNFFPLPEADMRISFTSMEDFIVAEVAPGESVCWNHLEGDAGRVFNHRSLDFLGEDLRTSIVHVLGVSLVPTVTSWVAATKACRRRWATANESLTEPLLRALSLSCEAQYAENVRQSRVEEETTHGAKKCDPLESLLRCVSRRRMAREYLFPLSGRWCRAAEGLFFCGPYYCSFAGLAMQPDSVTAPSLPVLLFTEAPHFATVAVLRRMGVLPIEECTERIATFNRINAPLTSQLHRRIATCVSHVQPFLRANCPHYYALVQNEVRKRLEHFSVALVGNPVLHEVLHFQRHKYNLQRELRYLYVASHNCLYGVDEEFSPVVGASAIADLFLPFEEREVRARLTCFLHQLLIGNMEESCTQQVGLSIPGNSPWVLSAPLDDRFRDHYPPGTDVFRGAICSNFGQDKSSKLSISLRGLDGCDIRSLPQWDTEMFDSAEDIRRFVQQKSSPASRSNTHKRNSYRIENDEYQGGATYDENEEESHGDEHDRVEDEGKEEDFTDETSLDEYKCEKLHFSLQRRGVRGGQNRLHVQRPQAPIMTKDENPDSVNYSLAAERFVYEQLRAKESSRLDVVWVNEFGESGRPYDIVLMRKKGEKGAAEVVSYVEVKSTCTSKRREFEMSLREFVYAARFGKAFKIYRVYGASSSAMRMMRVEEIADILTQWRSGKLSLTGQVKVMMS